MKSRFRSAASCGLLLLVTIRSGAVRAQTISSEVPERIQTTGRYLIYLHGKILEDQGALRPKSDRFGFFEYQSILEAFRKKGFFVISEARLRPVNHREYAKKVVRQIETLLKAGVPAEHITVLGASKGGVIAITTSSELRNPAVNYVILAACSEELFKEWHAEGSRLSGNVLSIFDSADQFGNGTCRTFFESSQGHGLSRSKEIVLTLGLGHGFLYRPLPEWVDPAAAWAD